jgi:hypothetical protein
MEKARRWSGVHRGDGVPAELNNVVVGLEERAEGLRLRLGFAYRAFVIEFAGTPKAGKSTSVEAVRHFFQRNGFRVHVLSERAALCPIPMKGHLFFNTWCATSMLAELLANIEADADIVIVDRGLFDALVWLTMQEKRGEITEEEANTIEQFIILTCCHDERFLGGGYSTRECSTGIDQSREHNEP